MQIRRTMLSQLRFADESRVAKTTSTAASPIVFLRPSVMSMPLPRPNNTFPVTPVAATPAAVPANAMTSAAPGSTVSPANSSHKSSIAFILSAPAASEELDSDSSSPSDSDREQRGALKHKRRQAPSSSAAAGSKSKYCIVEGCTSRAKHARKCWRHGGSVKCKVADCINRAKSRGVCWSHGGGTTCSHANCGTIAVSHGFCWAHGGGKRCEVGGCSRPAYERTQNMCSTHYKQHKSAWPSAEQR